MKRKIIIFLAVVLLMTAFLIGCAKNPASESTDTMTPTQQDSQTLSNKPQGTPQVNNEVSVGLVYADEDYETQLIKHSVESLLAISSIKINVTVLQADAQAPGTAIAQLVQGGSEIIFVCGLSRQEVLDAAALYPNVYFEIYNGTDTAAPNVGVFALKLYQQQYLNGMIAGFLSETGCIGYMAESAQNTDIRRVNAFALGAKAASSEAVVHFAWAGESPEDGFIGDTADSLSGESCDVIFEMDIDEELYLFARQNGVTLMGNTSEGYENVLPMVRPDALGYILSKARSVALGTYSPDDEVSGWIGISEGYTPSLDKYELTSEQAAAVNGAAESMALGQWDVFTGPINDVYGQIILPEGVSLPEEDLLQMLWYVGNIKALPPPMG